MFFIEKFVFLLVHISIELTTVSSLKEIDEGVCYITFLQEKQSVITQDPKDSVMTLRQIIITAALSSAITVVFMITVIIGVLIAKRVLCIKQQVGPAVSSNEAISANAEIGSQLSSLQEQSSVIQRIAIPDSQYETIDELNMIENSTIRMKEDELVFRKTNISSSSSDSKTSNASGVPSEDTEGYLHPYNTLEENWQK